MEPEIENVMLTAWDGKKKFRIVNKCNTAITKVRITHFAKGTAFSQLFTAELMNPGDGADHDFNSQKDKDDHWVVAFQIGPYGYMSRGLSKNVVEAGSDYKLTIREKEFEFSYAENDQAAKPKSEEVRPVYDCVK